MFLIKFAFYFATSFLLLSIPFQGDPLFYRLESMARPLTSKVFSYIVTNSSESIKNGAHITKKFFTNTIPPKKDSVRIKSSASQKPMGQYTREEKEFLKNILDSKK